MDEHRSPEPVDVIVIGGGAAGLSAGLSLGRARRSVVVVDAGEPRNAPAAHVHSMFTRDGTPPGELLAIGRAEVEHYGGEIVSGRALTATGAVDDGFVVELDDGRALQGRRLLVTTGLVDELPEVPGLADHWGTSVIHCPYCHGWEVQDRPIAVLGSGSMGAMKALLVRQWSIDVTLLVHTADAPTDEERERLMARGIRIVDGLVTEVVSEDGTLKGVRLESGQLVPVGAVMISPRMVARSAVLASLGIEPVEHPMGVGTIIASDAMGATDVPGVWVAGNVTDPMLQVGPAAAAGSMAAAAINMDLINEDTDRAVAAVRAQPPLPVMDQTFWDSRYGEHQHLWSGKPNESLVDGASALTPGRALDVGAGEGGDAVWLAEQGWQVTAVDISSVAIDRAREHAQERLGDGAAAITWTVADATEWSPPAGAFDLVSSQFVHLVGDWGPFIERCAAAVAPGGTLIIAGHHPSDVETRAPRPAVPHLMFTSADVVAHLGEGWTLVDTEPRLRTTHDDHGPFTIHDTVVVARRD